MSFLVTSKLFKSIKKTITLKSKIGVFYSRLSYSQEGEDLILEKIFSNIKKGFYVDVGSYHPFKYSNTYKLFKKGWNGINIDPNNECIDIFRKLRPQDINLNMAIGRSVKNIIYYQFEESALNTIKKQNYLTVFRSNQSRLVGKKQISVQPLADILDNYIKSTKTINLLNIDAEGSENEILLSNNWEKFTPQVVCLELLSDKDVFDIKKEKTIKYLYNKHYKLISRTIYSLIFVKNGLKIPIQPNNKV